MIYLPWLVFLVGVGLLIVFALVARAKSLRQKNELKNLHDVKSSR